MLSEELSANCNKLNAAYEKYERNRKKAIIVGMIAIGIAIAIIVLVPEGQNLTDRPEISYPGGISLLITVIILGYFQKNHYVIKKQDMKNI